MPYIVGFRRSSTTNITDGTQRVIWRLFGNVNLNRSHVWFSLLFPHLSLEGCLYVSCSGGGSGITYMRRWWW